MAKLDAQITLKEEHFAVGEQVIRILAPEPVALAAWYQQQRENAAPTPPPFWARVWPAAVGLAHYISRHSHYVAGRRVLELAGGLGLPSLVAARWAASVHCTDLYAEAVDLAGQSATINDISNLTAKQLDWFDLPEALTADVVLLSDINYEPHLFDHLYQVIERLIRQGATILLSTPQRLMAKPFIERLMHWCVAQDSEAVEMGGTGSNVSIYVLQA